MCLFTPQLERDRKNVGGKEGEENEPGLLPIPQNLNLNATHVSGVRLQCYTGRLQGGSGRLRIMRSIMLFFDDGSA